VRKPRSRLSPVHPGLLEPSLEPIGEPSGLPTLIGEDEHADRASLPVAHGLEPERLGSGCLIPQNESDRVERRTRLTSKKREGDVKARHGPAADEVTLTPGDELGHDV